MKKLALTSLMAVLAMSGANAANIIDGNPLYRPGEGRFYSITGVESHTKAVDEVLLGEEFAYGISDDLAVVVGTTAGQADWFDSMSWNTLSLGINWRVMDQGAWKADVLAGYEMMPLWGDHAEFMDKDTTLYNWTVGVRGGYVGEGFTIAGHVMFDYLNSESFNWNDKGIHTMRFGLDGQFVLNDSVNLVAGAEYTAWVDGDLWKMNMGSWDFMFGANFNIDETKFVGAYITKEMEHVAEGDWEMADGFGFGVKFGIDF
ncbi:MAG: hypothetical protein IKW57_03635 [Alphaproteobacteria bacterium]|nr:hypothetical protein [Alphaproteobacteria bacterium]